MLAGDRTAGDSPMRARLAALEMELEALKRGSDAGSDSLASADIAAATKQRWSRTPWLAGAVRRPLLL